MQPSFAMQSVMTHAAMAMSSELRAILILDTMHGMMNGIVWCTYQSIQTGDVKACLKHMPEHMPEDTDKIVGWVKTYLGVKNTQFCQGLHHLLVIDVARVVTIVTSAKQRVDLS